MVTLKSAATVPATSATRVVLLPNSSASPVASSNTAGQPIISTSKADLDTLLKNKQLMLDLIKEEDSRPAIDDRVNLVPKPGRRYMLIEWNRFHRAFHLGRVHIRILFSNQGAPSFVLYVMPSAPVPPDHNTTDIRLLKNSTGNPVVVKELLDPILQQNRLKNRSFAALQLCQNSATPKWKLMSCIQIMKPVVSAKDNTPTIPSTAALPPPQTLATPPTVPVQIVLAQPVRLTPVQLTPVQGTAVQLRPVELSSLVPKPILPKPTFTPPPVSSSAAKSTLRQVSTASKIAPPPSSSAVKPTPSPVSTPTVKPTPPPVPKSAATSTLRPASSAATFPIVKSTKLIQQGELRWKVVFNFPDKLDKNAIVLPLSDEIPLPRNARHELQWWMVALNHPGIPESGLVVRGLSVHGVSIVIPRVLLERTAATAAQSKVSTFLRLQAHLNIPSAQLYTPCCLYGWPRLPGFVVLGINFYYKR